MKNHLKGFSRYIKESNEFEMSSATSSPERVSLMALFECYAKTNYSNSKVLISADLNNPARGLTHGGIEIIPNPLDEEIEDAISQELEWVLYDGGQEIDSSDNY